MKKFMTRKHTEEHLSSRKERFSDLMGKGLFLLAFSSALSTNIWAKQQPQQTLRLLAKILQEKSATVKTVLL